MQDLDIIVEEVKTKINQNLFKSNTVIRVAFDTLQEDLSVYEIEKNNFVRSDIYITDFSLDIIDYEHILDKYEEYIKEKDYNKSMYLAEQIIQDYIDNNEQDLRDELQSEIEQFERENIIKKEV